MGNKGRSAIRWCYSDRQEGNAKIPRPDMKTEKNCGDYTNALCTVSKCFKILKKT